MGSAERMLLKNLLLLVSLLLLLLFSQSKILCGPNPVQWAHILDLVQVASSSRQTVKSPCRVLLRREKARRSTFQPLSRQKRSGEKGPEIIKEVREYNLK